eukprot:scaffold6534_cov20-Prasinocladus_malaysianus.AAC.2
MMNNSDCYWRRLPSFRSDSVHIASESLKLYDNACENATLATSLSRITIVKGLRPPDLGAYKGQACHLEGSHCPHHIYYRVCIHSVPFRPISYNSISFHSSY